MARAYRAISADSHVDPDANTFVDYMPAQYKEIAPRLESTEDGDFWIVGGQKQAIIGLSNMAGRRFEDYSIKLPRRTYGRAGAWDAKERLKDLDTDGLDAEVLFGMVVGGGAPDPAYRMALYHGFNNWLADFCGTAPYRFIGLGVMPQVDDMPVEDAIAELKHIKAIGLKGVWIPTYNNEKFYWDDLRYDSFWAACVDLQLPVHFHLSTGSTARQVLEPGNGLTEAFITNSSISLFQPLSSLIFTGIFERNPKLQFMLVEGNIGWLGYFLERADRVHTRHQYWSQPPIKRMPSEYFHENIGATFIQDLIGVQIRHSIGVDNILWSTDYPHTDTTWPNSMQAAHDHFEAQDVPSDEAHKILAGNAVRIYGL